VFLFFMMVDVQPWELGSSLSVFLCSFIFGQLIQLRSGAFECCKTWLNSMYREFFFLGLPQIK
jgi:hypothetical protein